MSKQDLIPITTHDRAVELGRKGGLSSAKSSAYHIAKNLQKWKNKNELIGYMMHLARTTDPLEAFTWMLENFAEQYELIAQEQNPDKKFIMRDKLLQRMSDFIRLRYGEFHRNLNIDLSAQFQDYLAQWRQAREGLLRSKEEPPQQPIENVKEETIEIPAEVQNDVSQATAITQEWDNIEPEEDEEETAFAII